MSNFPRLAHGPLHGEHELETRQPRWPYVALGVGAAIFFYLQLFHFPFVPIWTNDQDGTIFLCNAARMVHGDVLYRDLFQFNLPGTEYLYYFLFLCFGIRLWIAPLVFSILLIALWCAENFAVPVIFLAVLVPRFRRRIAVEFGSRQREALALYAFAGSFALLAVAGAPSAPRMSCSAAFAYILVTAILLSLRQRRLLIGALSLVCVAFVAEMAIAAGRPTYILNGPRGPIAFFHQDERDYYSSIAADARPGDSLFGEPACNFVLGLPNPAKIQWVEPDAYTRPEQVRELVQALQQHQTRIVIGSDEQPPKSDSEDNLQPFRDYLKEHYHALSDGVLVRNTIQ